MNSMNDNTANVNITFIICLMISFIIGCIAYYNIVKPSNNELMVELYDKGVHPAVVECINRSWTTTDVVRICEKVLTESDMTYEEAKELINSFK